MPLLAPFALPWSLHIRSETFQTSLPQYDRKFLFPLLLRWHLSFPTAPRGTTGLRLFLAEGANENAAAAVDDVERVGEMISADEMQGTEVENLFEFDLLTQ